MRWAAAVILLAIAPGCGASASSGTGGESSGGAGGGACGGFADEQSITSVTIRFRNDTPTSIFLPGTCSGVDYTIAPDGGSDGLYYTFDTSCLQTCQSSQTQPPIECGPCQPSMYLISPGMTRDVVWRGTGLDPSVIMPPACWAIPGSGGMCSRVVDAPAGTYRVEASAHLACGPGCTCDPSGVCSGTPTSPPVTSDPVTFTFPSTGVVEVVFGACAFGCADP
jgi:hypothetical protein